MHTQTDKSSTTTPAGAPPGDGFTHRAGVAGFDSAALLSGGSEVLIRHGAETYRLRLTRQNRLILTK